MACSENGACGSEPLDMVTIEVARFTDVEAAPGKKLNIDFDDPRIPDNPEALMGRHPHIAEMAVRYPAGFTTTAAGGGLPVSGRTLLSLVKTTVETPISKPLDSADGRDFADDMFERYGDHDFYPDATIPSDLPDATATPTRDLVFHYRFADFDSEGNPLPYGCVSIEALRAKGPTAFRLAVQQDLALPAAGCVFDGVAAGGVVVVELGIVYLPYLNTDSVELRAETFRKLSATLPHCDRKTAYAIVRHTEEWDGGLDLGQAGADYEDIDVDVAGVKWKDHVDLTDSTRIDGMEDRRKPFFNENVSQGGTPGRIVLVPYRRDRAMMPHGRILATFGQRAGTSDGTRVLHRTVVEPTLAQARKLRTACGYGKSPTARVFTGRIPQGKHARFHPIAVKPTKGI